MKAMPEDIWSEYRGRLMRFVLSRGVEPNDAEDIVHEVLAKALLPGGGPEDETRLQQWLYQVVRNAIADHWRRRRPSEEVPDDLAMPGTGEAINRPDDLLACIEPFLLRLEGEDASILKLADEDQVPQAQIARQLGISLSGAKSRIQRARARVLAMYRQCCAVELDRKGRLVDYDPSGCDAHCPSGESAGTAATSPCRTP